MSDDTTDRLALPLLSAGQAQKEQWHNEALALLDLACQPTVEAIGSMVPPPSPSPGQCWIVGAGAGGAWAGRGGELAGWTRGGWRFVAPRPGWTVWSVADGTHARYTGTGWSVGELSAARLVIGGVQSVGPRRAAIPDPAGGGVTDTVARATIAAMLDALRGHGLIAVEPPV